MPWKLKIECRVEIDVKVNNLFLQITSRESWGKKVLGKEWRRNCDFQSMRNLFSNQLLYLLVKVFQDQECTVYHFAIVWVNKMMVDQIRPKHFFWFLIHIYSISKEAFVIPLARGITCVGSWRRYEYEINMYDLEIFEESGRKETDLLDQHSLITTTTINSSYKLNWQVIIHGAVRLKAVRLS